MTTRHRMLAPAFRGAPTIPQGDKKRERENPILQRYLRVKPCPIKHLRSLAAAEHQQQPREADRGR
jgi:hypothetical protein